MQCKEHTQSVVDVNGVYNSDAMKDLTCTFETMGSDFSFSRAMCFANHLNDCNLMDIDIIGGMHTWRRHCRNDTHIHKKLDCYLANLNQRIHFPHALVEFLPPFGSDHTPILLSFMKDRSKTFNVFHCQVTYEML
ncbi:hypothetical protein VNO78_06369 [Psophocarpus tetragonolobus]|uniref:Uncharacterized protein n=1 Tax=Psophocarpus tetragonolobus TaxID=3891 RepID=A0AAN9SV17_PSOTE